MNSSVEGVFGRHPQFFICILIANIVIWNVTETDRDQKCMDGLRIAGALKSKTKTKQDNGGNVMGLLIALIVLILVALAIAVSCIKIVPQANAIVV